MQYESLVRDFASRTRQNLEFFRSKRVEASEAEAFEVTQLINSMLGLLVFPQQKFWDQIPTTPVFDLPGQGWPVPTPIEGYQQVRDLKMLVSYLRNAVAHCNLEFISDGRGELTGLRMWNIHPREKSINWKAELSLQELERLSERLTDLLLESQSKPVKNSSSQPES